MTDFGIENKDQILIIMLAERTRPPR